MAHPSEDLSESCLKCLNGYEMVVKAFIVLISLLDNMFQMAHDCPL